MVRYSLRSVVSLIFVLGCADEFKEMDQSDVGVAHQLEHAVTKNGLGMAAAAVGDTCASGCVWSHFAVSFGVQSPSHLCQGTACVCVEAGNIFGACQPSTIDPSGQGDPPADLFGSGGFESQPNASSGGAGASHNGANQQPVFAGTGCGQGCIWSSFAVQLGAQPGERTCVSGGQCACVEYGNVWRACGGAGQSVQPVAERAPQPAAPNPRPQTRGYGGNYNPAMGARLANIAYRIARSRNTIGYCYSAAADAIESVVPRFLYGNSAYMAADQLGHHSRFIEISTNDLLRLPAGAVVVWGKGRSPHGHISIALGDGREASDHVTGQMLWHYGGAPARVFLPR
ncbi:MAG: hypothetical protein VX589_16750 [Myxococcota bacterium]|nr:hypothetical protein [Myxococcota bacterium]